MLYEQCVVDKKNGVSKLCDITFKIRMRLINNLCIDIILGLRFKQTQLDHKGYFLKFYDYLIWWNMSSIYYRTLVFYKIFYIGTQFNVSMIPTFPCLMAFIFNFFFEISSFMF